MAAATAAVVTVKEYAADGTVAFPSAAVAAAIYSVGIPGANSDEFTASIVQSGSPSATAGDSARASGSVILLPSAEINIWKPLAW